MAYSKTTWDDNDVITKEKMNNLELGCEAANNGIPSAATEQVAGIVKQASMVPDAVGDNVTKEEFNALLAALKTAGVMASS